MKVLNAFSLSMLGSLPATLDVEEISAAQAAEFLGYAPESCVGHADTAKLFETILGVPVPVNRVSVTIPCGEDVIVGQYIGPRLPEGATTLPEGASIRWMLVTVL